MEVIAIAEGKMERKKQINGKQVITNFLKVKAVVFIL